MVDLMNEAVKTYTNVSQFGPYADMADKYMAAPATTRDYPPGDKDAYFKEIEQYFGKDYVEKLKKNNGWSNCRQLTETWHKAIGFDHMPRRP